MITKRLLYNSLIPFVYPWFFASILYIVVNVSSLFHFYFITVRNPLICNCRIRTNKTVNEFLISASKVNCLQKRNIFCFSSREDMLQVDSGVSSAQSSTTVPWSNQRYGHIILWRSYAKLIRNRHRVITKDIKHCPYCGYMRDTNSKIRGGWCIGPKADATHNHAFHRRDNVFRLRVVC